MKVYSARPVQAGSTHRLVLQGELDLATTAGARSAVDELLSPGCTLELDLGGLTFMDSAGARFLVWAGRGASACGARVVITETSRPVRRLLEVARADDGVRHACTWALAS